MALQFLYSTWWENDIERTIRLATDGLDDADIEYILHTVSVTDRFDMLPEDDENEELANTLYLRLPSSAYAIVRTGCYTVQNTNQKNNSIVHAYVQQKGEEVFPMLYAINNCFRMSLTEEEQAHFLGMKTLPETPFPRPQFKLSQAEVRKFFSQGRLRTLACLLQAVIDSHGNQRVILLKDNYHSLKYWFYGIHSCLPKNRTEFLTYSTYAFHKPDDCILICAAPGHGMDLDKLAEEGNFVIDNLDDIGCGDIESANFTSSIVRDFWEDMNRLPEMLEGVEILMDTYRLNVATAAGLYKLIEFDFDWFRSPHEIHYFLGKIGTIDKDSLEMISHKLWETFKSPDFKFPLNTDNLPILAYMFRNTDDKVRWEIISYIEGHKENFGYRPFDSFEALYCDLLEKLSFITEFIPLALMQEGRLDEYCQNRSASAYELATFLNIIVDKYEEYKNILGEEILHENAIFLFEGVLHANALDAATAICARSLSLPYDFLRYVLVQGILNDSNSPDDSVTDVQIPLTELNLPDEFVYRIARLFIQNDPSLALELVKNHAREGKYSESTLALYHDLCQSFPDETADFDETLHERAVYADFVTDSIFYKFASLQHATREELTDFFVKYYLTGQDKNRYFETKLLQHLQHQLPVNSIEMAEYFLNLLISTTEEYREFTLFNVLITYLLEQSAIDLFDYYSCNMNEFNSIVGVLSSENISFSSSFAVAMPLLNMTDWLENKESVFAEALILALFEARIERLAEEDQITDDLGLLMVDKIVKLSCNLSGDTLGLFVRNVVIPVYCTKNGKRWIDEVWNNRIHLVPASLYPLAAQFALYSEADDNIRMLSELTKSLIRVLSVKKCKEIYPIFMSYLENSENRQSATEFLAHLFYRKYSFLRRIFAVSKKRLFEKKDK